MLGTFLSQVGSCLCFIILFVCLLLAAAALLSPSGSGLIRCFCCLASFHDSQRTRLARLCSMTDAKIWCSKGPLAGFRFPALCDWSTGEHLVIRPNCISNIPHCTWFNRLPAFCHVRPGGDICFSNTGLYRKVYCYQSCRRKLCLWKKSYIWQTGQILDRYHEICLSVFYCTRLI